jgi:hypothetical protein
MIEQRRLKMKKRVPLLLTMVVLVMAMFLTATQAFASQGTGVNPNAQQMTIHVGWVTGYLPGESITIQTHDGSFFTYQLTESTSYLPASRAGELKIGSRVTIISPNGDPAAGTAIAAGVVIHPWGSGEGSQPPAGTETPVVTESPVVTENPVATETPIPSETPIPTEIPGENTPTPVPGLVFPVTITTGIVTEYTPNVSLTIQSADSTLHSFVLSPSLTVLPAADQLVLGAQVTVVAFYDSGAANWVAFGVVIQAAP